MERLDPAPGGVGVFEVEDGSGRWEVAGYFAERPDQAGLALLATIYSAEPFAVSKVPDRDWVAQVRRELSPVHAGPFVVHGSHDRDAVPDGKIGLCIDAAMAFGTGHHGTTTGCLVSLHRLHRRGFRPHHIADIGTGTGVLAMGAARLWPAQIVASDIDPIATATARANFQANGLHPRVQLICAPGLAHPDLRSRGPYDLIVANILASPLKRMAPSMAQASLPGTYLVLSGLLHRQAKAVQNVFQGFGFLPQHREAVGEWSPLTLRRR